MDSRPEMNVSHRAANTQVFNLMVYNRALHPELMDLQARRLYRHGGYEAECWVGPATHVVRFQYDDSVLTEAVLENGDHLPEIGLLHALPCLGEKDFELEPESVENLGYVTTVQTEMLTDNLYAATYREMCDFAEESDALCHKWDNESGSPSLSIVDIQKFKRELHLQSYHLIASAGMVLRTQSIFEML